MKEGVPVLLLRNRWVGRALNKGYGKAGLPFTVAPVLALVEPGGTGGLEVLVKQVVGPESAWYINWW